MRDLTAVAKEGSHHWVPIQDLPFDEIILFAMQPTTHLDPRMSVCLQACIMRAAVEFCSNPDPRGNAPTRHLLL